MMCIYIYIYVDTVYIYISVITYVYIHKYICVCIYIYMYIYICVFESSSAEPHGWRVVEGAERLARGEAEVGHFQTCLSGLGFRV